ncbi:MAG: hypothetical protein RLZ10_2867 [Bacteroidota bacterium]|jgi:hypothetical protein
MGKKIRLTESDLNRIVKKTIMEMDGMTNSIEMYDFNKRKMVSGLHQLKSSIDSGDKETASHIAQVLLLTLNELDSYVDEMKR